MCDVKKMFLFVLKRDKICFGGILDNFCYSVQSVVGWNLGGAFLVVIFPMKSGGPQIWVPPPDNNTMIRLAPKKKNCILNRVM